MIATTQGPEFTPPPQPGLLRSVGLALLAHGVLVLALSWGLKWKRDDATISVEAELWSAAVQQAAPKPVVAPPPPPPPVVQAPPPAPPPPQPREAEIAVEREKQREADQKARQEQARREEARQEAERQRQAADRRRQDDLRKQEQAKKAAEDRKRAEQTVARDKREREQEENRVARQREENLKRIQGMAGATGAADSTGTALRSSGPSDSYGGRIRGRVKPNIVFTDDIQGNPTTTVLVQLSPDGTITGRRITRSSGVKTWDDAVIRALDRTETFPRDIDGRVPPSVEMVFRPRD